MDTLVALGTTSGWTASLAYMILDVTSATPTSASMQSGSDAGPNRSMGTGEMGYFDSSVFLMLFILLGRYLEGMSRKQTSEAIDALGDMRTPAGLLYSGNLDCSSSGEEDLKGRKVPDIGSSRSSTSSVADLRKVDSIDSGAQANVQSLEITFFERGDIILIPSGSAVPLDSMIISLGSTGASPTSNQSNFDESSLTGESQPVLKSPGDMIFTGSTNLGPAGIIAKVEQPAGDTMLDSIVSAVSDAMARKASIERLADLITGYFVPFIVFIAVLTFFVWVMRGYLGSLPSEWISNDDGSASRGGWALFAVQFSVAVLVVACPCGIGLAAPTAQMVGTGILARLGIVPYGGGEAFQNAAGIDVVVFDKTGTCTMGEFVVAHHLRLGKNTSSSSSLTSSEQNHAAKRLPDKTLYSIVMAVEETSSHPISKGLQQFCKTQIGSDGLASVVLLSLEEIPGKGLKAKASLDSESYDIIIGNEAHAKDHSVDMDEEMESCSETALSMAHTWGLQANTAVFVAFRNHSSDDDDVNDGLGSTKKNPYDLQAMFALQDPPREEAGFVVRELEKQGIPVYMCTGDALTPALAIADAIGIRKDCVYAGVLPMGKKTCVANLQQGGESAKRILELKKRKMFWNSLFRSDRKHGKANVLFVGDGINDIVAMNEARVGVSMGTGASVTLGSSDFCLLSSNLTSLLTLLSLARATTNKIKFNFGWAIVFNAILIPIAAGAYYSLGRTRLPPVWAALAMALSSISVVLSSVSLRYTFSVPKEVRQYKAERGRVE